MKFFGTLKRQLSPSNDSLTNNGTTANKYDRGSNGLKRSKSHFDKQSIVDIADDWINHISLNTPRYSQYTRSQYKSLSISHFKNMNDLRVTEFPMISSSPASFACSLSAISQPLEVSINNKCTSTPSTTTLDGHCNEMNEMGEEKLWDEVITDEDELSTSTGVFMEDTENYCGTNTDELFDSRTTSMYCFTPQSPQSDAERTNTNRQQTSVIEQMATCCMMPNDSGYGMLRMLIEQHVGDTVSINSVRDKTRNNCTLLHLAAKHDNIECMSFLINNQEADVNVDDWCGSSPLHYSVSGNARDATILLLSSKANLNKKDHYGSSPLQIALYNNNLDIMRDLILWGADVHLRGKRGDTVLHQACKGGFLKRVKFLIESCNASILRMNTNNEHALFSALAYPSVLQYLCDHIETSQQFVKLISSTNTYGKTVFHVAAERGYLEGLLVLIREVKKWADEGEQDLIEQILVQRLNEYENEKGLTPLHLAVSHGREEVTKFLAMSLQVDVNKKCRARGESPIQLAIRKCNKSICEILIDHGKVEVAKNELVAFQQLGVDPQLNEIKKRQSVGSVALTSIKKKASSLFV